MSKIAHISDIHIRGTQRHKEYKKIFNKLYEDLITNVKPDLIVCTGDIFHTKTSNITPEVIELIVWFFNCLADIAPLHMILGNHDIALNNADRQDVITPIVKAINRKDVVLYKESGNYVINLKDAKILAPNGEVKFGVFSCCDKQGWAKVVPCENDYNIALFHGSVAGCILDNETEMIHSEVDTSFFNGWDIGMLGDIHKAQFLGYRDGKPWVGYSGSYCQQNFGENRKKGYLVWDIKSKNDWTTEFREITNDTPFITVEWAKSVEETIKSLIEAEGNNLAGWRVRINSIESLQPTEKTEIEKTFKQLYRVEEVAFKSVGIIDLNTIDTGNFKANKSSLRTDPQVLQDLYKQFIDSNKERFPLSDEQIIVANEVISNLLEKAKDIDTKVQGSRDVIWSIKEMNFSNLYRFGEENNLNFQSLSGLVGLFGNNKIGKSSVIGTLMYGLYNTTDRGPVKSSYIINKTKQSGEVDILITVNGIDYLVSRSASKNINKKGQVDEEKATSSLSLSRINSDGSKIELNNENGDTKVDTDKILRNLIGTPQDFIMTTFANSDEINKFIKEGATQRKSILNRFLDLDIFEILSKLSNEECTAIQTKLSRFKDIIFTTEISALEGRIKELYESYETNSSSTRDTRSRIDLLKEWLSENNVELFEKLLKEINKTNEAIEVSITNLKLADLKLKDSDKAIQEYTNKIALIKNSGALSADIEDLSNQLSNIKKVSNNYLTSLVKEKEAVAKQAALQKSIKKLEVIPCGDQYPTCFFIKDAYQDKLSIISHTQTLEAIGKEVDSLLEQVGQLNESKIESMLKLAKSAIESIKTSELLLDKEIEKRELYRETISSKKNFLKELERTSGELQERKEKYHSDAIKTKKLNFESLKATLFSLEQQERSILLEIGSKEEKVQELIKNQEQYSSLIVDYRIKDSIQQSFSKIGIPAILLKSQLPAINDELEKILAGITNFKITLDADSGTASNTLDIFIEDKHSKRVVELASGMEKLVASIALRVAFSNISGLPKPDFFILDEVFSSLDPEHFQSVVKLLQNIKTRFKAVIIISHLEQIKEIVDKIIEIKNEGMDSKINVN